MTCARTAACHLLICLHQIWCGMARGVALPFDVHGVMQATMLNPAILARHSVPVHQVLQEVGEFVVTFPSAYHASVDLGDKYCILSAAAAMLASVAALFLIRQQARLALRCQNY